MLTAQDNAPESWEPSTDWEGRLKDVIWTSGDDHPRFRHDKWREVFEQQLATTPLTIQTADPFFSLPLGEESVRFTHWISQETIWERYRSQSQFAVLEGQQLDVRLRITSLYWTISLTSAQNLRRRFEDAMAGSDAEKNERGEIPLHGQTYLAWTTAIPGAPLKEGL